MPSRASTSLLLSGLRVLVDGILHVSMPSQASTSLLHSKSLWKNKIDNDSVSMPSRASTSLLHHYEINFLPEWGLCQCPHGLMPHFDTDFAIELRSVAAGVSMPSRAYASFLLILSSSHWQRMRSCVNALTGLCLISTY